MKNIFTTICCLLFAVIAYSQCPEQATFTSTANHGLCQDAFNIVPYIESCQTICMSNVNAGASGQVADPSCLGGTTNNDLFLVAPNPFASIPSYDGSLAFRWVDWPNKATGALPPYITIHSEVEASFLGTTAQSIDCTDGFAAENAFCVDPVEVGNQFFALAGTLPTTAQLDPIVDAQAGIDVDVDDVHYFIHFNTTDGATGDICFEFSPYESGYICGDATDIALNGNNSQVTANAAGCLCETALYGGLNNPKINIPSACGVESEASAWYKMDLPFGCNSVDVDMTAWGGTGDYNISLVSNVDCPGTTDVNPITGAPIFIPGEEPALPMTIEASACGQSLSTACAPLPAGEYYIVISGSVDRPTYAFDVTVNEASPTAGNATSTSNNQDVCSESTIQVSTSAFDLPASATCGQDIVWYYSNNSTFNPYNNEGTFAASGTTNVDIVLPANTTCSTETYFIKGVVSDNGTTAVAGCQNSTNPIIVNVFPEIGLATIVNSACIVQVAGRCPNFTVNGNAGSDTYLASFADDGTSQSFVVSNGLVGCNQTFTETISCSGSCTQPTATTNLICDANDPFNFYVEINFAPGSANSYSIIGTDGSSLSASAAGTYTAGPFTNDNPVTLTIENTEDTACNLPLGNFINNCNPQTCPNLTSATAPLSGDVCVGEQVLLQASVDQGTLNTDYTAQWYLNGVEIPNANTLNYLHSFYTQQGCSSEFQVFSISIECLNPDAAASTSSSMNLSSGGFNVYPVPQLGIDFYPSLDNCIVAPFDNCGGLNIIYTPTTDLTPGATATISYLVSVPGAPAGCEASGTYEVQCPITTCTNDVGEAVQPTENVICVGESFNLELTGTALQDAYSIGYAVTTTNPYSDLEGAVNTAVQNGDVIGPYNSGDIPSFNNGTDYTDGTYYFVPFSSMNIASGTVVWSTSGSFNVSAPFGGGSSSFTIPELPYCAGVSSYSMNIVIDQNSNESTLNAIDGMNSPIWAGPGSSVDYYDNTVNFTNNPSGTSHTINGSANFFWGSSINYTVTATYNVDNIFPTICPTCTDVSSAITYQLLPDIVLTPAPTPIVCENSLFDLTDLNPTSNLVGTYTWYDNDPSTTATPLANNEVTMAVGANTYWVQFAATDDATCTESISVTVTTTASPVINTPATPAPICSGEAVNLNLMNNTISGGQAGTITWFRGNPSMDPFAVQLTTAIASNQTPTDGTLYAAVFEDASTGCSSQVTVTYTVLDLPSLVPPVINPSVCTGESFDLTTIESSLTTESGTFEWYLGNPSNGGTLLTNTTVNPSTSTEYCTVFTDANSGCENSVCLTLDINPLPSLNNLPPQGPLCQGDMFDLSTLNSQLTSTAGSFVWYNGNPETNGTLISNTNIVPNATTVYYVVYTATLTGCSDTGFITFLIENSPNLQMPVSSSICMGESVNLNALESGITADAGSFVWYEGNPNTGGTQINDASNLMPTMDTDYFVVFTSNSGCTGMTSASVIVNDLPVFNTIDNPHLCNGGSVELTDYNALLSNNAGTFEWSENGNVLTNTFITPSETTTFDLLFTDMNGCANSTSMEVVVYSEIQGATASYDCTSNQIIVDLTSATGGTGSGYIVSASSPNQDGESLANNSSWTIDIVDSEGCTQTSISGTVNCITCEAGDAMTNASTVLCCGDSIQITIENETLSAGNIIGYALTSSTDGAVTQESDLDNAIQIFPGDMNNGLEYISSCNLDAGDYFLTPFIAQESEGQITELLYDTLNGCTPNGEFCPEIEGTDWILDPLIIHFPDGSSVNVNDDQAFGLPITPELLAGVGGIPCLSLTDLYAGDPNGVWWFEINNVGTGDLIFSTEAFDVTVDASACSALNGVSQVVTVAPINGTIAGESSDSIGFLLPPPVEVELLVYDTLNGCTPMGEFCPEIEGTDWILDPLIFVFPDGSEYNVNQEQAFGLAITPDLLEAVGGIGCISLTDLYQGDPNGTWSIQATNTGTGDVIVNVPAFDVTVDASTCAELNGVNQVFTVPAIQDVVAGGATSALDFDIHGPAPSSFPTVNPVCEDYGTPIMFTLLDETNPDCYPVSNEELTNIQSFNAYPNPTNGNFTIELGLEDAATVQIVVTDILGRNLSAQTFDLSSGLFTHTLNLQNYAAGMYMVSISSGKDLISQKVIKQ